MRAAIVSRVIDLQALLREVSGTQHGATVLFVGTVRELNDGRDVSGIDYSAYEPMADRELRAIVEEACHRWKGADVVAEHRLGTLELGEVSIAIAASHPHRDEAFGAARHVIEEVKKRVPIWKREHYADGTRAWVEAHTAAPDPAGAHP